MARPAAAGREPLVSELHDDIPYTARIPADVGYEDRILGPLTARQTAILAGAAGVLLLGLYASRPVMPPLAYLALVAPVAAVVTALVLGRRDGVSMDRLAMAAWRFWRAPKRQVNAPDGIPALPDITPTTWTAMAGPAPAELRMPCQDVTEPGVVDLGRDGYAALASCSTVNFDLRTGAEQQALTAGFARWLNSLTGPTQLLVRSHRLDLRPLIDDLVQSAPVLPHPALEAAALAHAGFLNDLAASSDLLSRQVLLIARETTVGPGSGAGPVRVRHRIAEAARALAAAEVTTTPLDASETTSALSCPQG